MMHSMIQQIEIKRPYCSEEKFLTWMLFHVPGTKRIYMH